MNRLLIIFLLAATNLTAVAQFAPAVGQTGTTAMNKDSSAFIAWASACTVERGYQDIADTSLGKATVGEPAMATGKAGNNGVLSLGDGGSATLTFNDPIRNGNGFDFAVFENSFSDTYLELAYVEVSSDGINFFRFPAVSNTQDTVQIDGFGSIDPTNINNLAGKYRALYGTPFDLEELASEPGLNVNAITHVKIIDVVGCIESAYARYDKNQYKINDPWKTPFASGGFDLDAVGVIHNSSVGISSANDIYGLKILNNPVKNELQGLININRSERIELSLIDMNGRIIRTKESIGSSKINMKIDDMENGIYLLKVSGASGISIKKLIIDNE